jgi:hypothetical protein
MGCVLRRRAASTPTASPGRWTWTPSAEIASRAVRSRYADAAVASFDEKVVRAAEREGLATIETSARRQRRR